MNPKFALSLFCLSLLATLHAWALPDSCGKAKVEFKVVTGTSQPLLPAIEAGKAQIVFLETEQADGEVLSGVEARLGIDGTWIGATKGDSYFVVAVSPGQHHLCANWQADFAYQWQRTSVAPLTVEPGKVYYYRVNVRHIRTREIEYHSLDLMPVNEDEGKYLVNVLDLATATAKK